MTFQDYFPIWNKLQTDQQDRIRSNLNFRTVKKGTILHNGDMDCTGLLLVKAGSSGPISSDEGGRSPFTACSTGICACSLRPASCAPSSLRSPSRRRRTRTSGSSPRRSTRTSWRRRRLWPTNQRADGQPVLRGHVADGAGHVEEPGQAGGGLLLEEASIEGAAC